MTRSPTWWWSRRIGRGSGRLSRSASSTHSDAGGAGTPEGEVRLRCTKAEFERLDPAEATYFPGDEDYEDTVGRWEPDVLWPYYAPASGMVPGAPGTPGGPGTIPGPVTVNAVPDKLPGEDEVFRGDHVHATDGDIGHVLGFVIEAGSGRVTSILLREGHLLGRRTVLIPRSAVAEVGADGFRLNITREQVRHLPPADDEHPQAGLQPAGDLRQRGQRAVAGDEIGQAAAVAPFEQVGTDLFRAADEDRRHLPHRLGPAGEIQPLPAVSHRFPHHPEPQRRHATDATPAARTTGGSGTRGPEPAISLLPSAW